MKNSVIYIIEIRTTDPTFLVYLLAMNTDQPISIRILFFAKARDLSEISQTILQLDTNSILAGDLLEKICSEYNLNVIKPSLILAVNETYCSNLQERLLLKEGDEIAIIPPISGG